MMTRRVMVSFELDWIFSLLITVSQRLLRHRSLLVILAVAALLRFWALDRADVITDEAFYAFRSVGYLDFLFSPDQPTPLEHLNARPAWTYLSFHDAPPLAFILQSAALRVFGENLWGVRAVFAFSGVLAVLLVSLIARRLAGERAGLFAAAVMAVLTSAVWVSRIGLLESLVITFELLAVWAFLWAGGGQPLPRPPGLRWVAVGIALGLAFLTKYTAFALVPLFVAWLLGERRFRDLPYLGVALALAVLVFSPVIIYNLKLFETTGHFDLQFSYLLGQNPVEWQQLPGKAEFTSLVSRGQKFFPNLSDATSPIGLAAFAITIVASASVALRRPRTPMRGGRGRPRESSRADRFFLAGLATVAAALLIIGPSFRFLTMLSPWIALIAGLWAARWLPEHLSWRHGLFGVLLVAELAYSVNTSIVTAPIGSRYVAFSRLAYDRYAWGYNDLEQYLTERLDQARPGVALTTKYIFVNDLQRQARASARQAGKPAKSILIVYDASLSDTAVLWSLHRRLVYRGWPVVSAGAFHAAGGQSFFRQQGVREFVFIKADGDILRSGESPEPARALAAELSQRGVLPRVITASAGSARMTAWEFSCC